MPPHLSCPGSSDVITHVELGMLPECLFGELGVLGVQELEDGLARSVGAAPSENLATHATELHATLGRHPVCCVRLILSGKELTRCTVTVPRAALEGNLVEA